MTQIEQGSANVYADLGIADAEEMLVKAQLATKIGEIIKRRKLTQIQAAELLGIPQPKLSNLLRAPMATQTPPPLATSNSPTLMSA